MRPIGTVWDVIPSNDDDGAGCSEPDPEATARVAPGGAVEAVPLGDKDEAEVGDVGEWALLIQLRAIRSRLSSQYCRMSSLGCRSFADGAIA